MSWNLNGWPPCPVYPASYDDEVTAEQVRKIDEALAANFENGEWIPVESETSRKS